MQSRQAKAINYNENYCMIPRDFNERLLYMCDKYNLSQNKMQEILAKKDALMQSMEYKSLRIVLYEEPEGTPRPRARLVNRYNALDAAKSGGNFIQVYSITGKSDNMYMKKLVTEQDYLEAGQLIYTPCEVYVNAFFKSPSSMTVTDLFLAEIGLIRPINKPDWDNIGKKYSDMYNGNIWLDDNLVIEGHVKKWYSILPRVEIDLDYSSFLYNKYQYNLISKRMNNTNIKYFGG